MKNRLCALKHQIRNINGRWLKQVTNLWKYCLQHVYPLHYSGRVPTWTNATGRERGDSLHVIFFSFITQWGVTMNMWQRGWPNSNSHMLCCQICWSARSLFLFTLYCRNWNVMDDDIYVLQNQIMNLYFPAVMWELNLVQSFCERRLRLYTEGPQWGDSHIGGTIYSVTKNTPWGP